MPNHVKNIIKFDGCTDEQFDEIRRLLASDGVLGTVDFNNLDKMADELNIEAGVRGEWGYEEYKKYIREVMDITDEEEKNRIMEKHKSKLKYEESWDLGRQYYENIQNYGHPNWYEWCIKHWGTKWNAYDFVIHKQEERIVEFSTAWSPALKLFFDFSKRKELKDVVITHSYADEDIGRNVGKFVFLNGKAIDRDVPDTHSKEAFEMSAEIRGLDLGVDCWLFLDAENNTYVYDEERGKLLEKSIND